MQKFDYSKFENCLWDNEISRVKAAVDTKIGKFTKKEIADICPSISVKSVEAGLRKLIDEHYIERHGAGKNSFYAKVSA